VKVQYTSFEVRKDKYFFSKLQKHSDPLGLLVANFIDCPDAWIGDIVNAEISDDVYLMWKGRQNSISYLYSEEIKKLPTDIDSSLQVFDGQHPKLLKYYIGKTISPETIIILNVHMNFIKYWQQEIADPAIWPVLCSRLQKYTPFVTFDKAKTRKITVDYFHE